MGEVQTTSVTGSPHYDPYAIHRRLSNPGTMAAIKKDGIRAFVKRERARWTCTACGSTIDGHHYRCSSCGREPE